MVPEPFIIPGKDPGRYPDRQMAYKFEDGHLLDQESPIRCWASIDQSRRTSCLFDDSLPDPQWQFPILTACQSLGVSYLPCERGTRTSRMLRATTVAIPKSTSFGSSLKIPATEHALSRLNDSDRCSSLVAYIALSPIEGPD
jgi:hypothetical protein